jgi:putative transposase
VYYLPKPVSAADLALMRRIDELHLKHPFMGARMLRDQLAREGVFVGRRHIGTLMRRMGIEALAPQPGTSKATPGNKIYPYLLRKLAIVRANQVWALDTTYIPMARGFVYLTAVVDVASRRVLTHKVAITLEACHAVEIIEEAFARFGLPEIVNTDQGSQFTASDFTDAVLNKGCKLSMDGRGAWRDRSGCANLNNYLSGNSGHKVRPGSAGHEGVFDGQEISTPYPAHAYTSVQSQGGTGGIA